ncbi:hypothetical protein POSPLADRAFT_1061894 [Postia placenta MAD-698-R-SB12]|uniref:Ribosomal L1 domain-containing protein 1 n=1 Tax=Postia placenta MAD-698-R-SB12 TaxID=670580 RepID=A0A1X6MLB2_9APHY|nr:hypothetical protein POSPLADRAFT_1061894 [Postia placenta MAD-698-R-SB12]OSX57194.1 hypothetical protein POSPLADRAFT_1061894 [Postia placenta MAD-698-R-SB12]
MAKDLIGEHVSERQCKLAVNALLEHVRKIEEKKAEKELLPGKEQNVWFVVTVKQMHPEKKPKPYKIPIAHPLVDPRTSSVCLITKDPQREYKDLLESHGIRFISRVVGITKLKGKFKPFEARRLLLKENGLFLADERVIPLLPGLLGKKFFEAKKQPIPVSLTKKDLKGELERAISSTYFHQNQGTCTSVKIGALSQTPAQILDNLKMALPAIVKNIKGEWDNIQSIHIKTNSSASLPIWSCNLGDEEGARWDGLTARESAGEDSGDETESEEKEEAAESTKKSSAASKKTSVVVDVVESSQEKSKGKKRAAEDDTTKPQKKIKASPAQETPIKSKKATPAAKSISSKLAAPNAVASDVPSKKLKKGKAEGEAKKTESSATPAASTSAQAHAAPAPAGDGGAPKKKSKGKSVADTGVSSQPVVESTALADDRSAAEPRDPATPAAARKKKARASAVDFFEDGPAPPPNTPADASAAKKKKAKTVEVTPLSKAIAQLADEGSAAPETPLPKIRKRKGDAASAAHADKGTPTSASAETGGLSMDDLKKKRALSGTEKKKGKVVNSSPAAKSAKSAIVGKKRL